MKKALILPLSCFILGTTLLGSGLSQPQATQATAKQVLNWTESNELATADISKATDTLSFNVLLNTQEGLYRLDKNGTPQPALATKTELSKDGLTYKFTLRKDAKWQNGDPVTAKDFVYSWQRTVDPKTTSQDAFYLFQVKNAKAINAGKLNPDQLGIKADDDYHLTVTLERPVSYFKKLLAWPLFFPQNQKAVAKYGQAYGTEANKTDNNGPYTLTKWNGSSDSWTLVKNKNYWDQKHVKLNKINELVVKDPQTGLNLYQSHKVDETVLSGEQVPNFKTNKDFVKREASNLLYLNLNQNKVKAFKNQNVRRAFSLAINRKQLVNNVLQDGSQTPKGFTPVGLGKDPQNGHDFAKETEVKTAVTSNLKTARALIKKGLAATHTKSLSLTLVTDDTQNAKRTAEYVQNALEKLPHVKVAIHTLPKVQRLTLQQKGNYQLILTGWQSVFADPVNFLDIWTSDSSYNTSGWHNTKFDQAIADAEGKYANEPVKRWQALQNAEKELLTDQGTIPLYQQTTAQLLQPKVKGIVYNGSGVPYDWKTAYIK
ncbi:peptide ABC transporter substrate-binding protein [Agrilactobacillus fermenti]